MKYALILQKNDDGIVTGCSTISYKNYLTDLKNRGHQPDHRNFSSTEQARIAGNLLLGTDGKKKDSLPEADDDETTDNTNDETTNV